MTVKCDEGKTFQRIFEEKTRSFTILNKSETPLHIGLNKNGKPIVLRKGEKASLILMPHETLSKDRVQSISLFLTFSVKGVFLSLNKEIEQADNLIKYCFAYWPETKSNDRLLFLQVWGLQGLKLTSEQRSLFLHEVLSPETISRRRRKIQEEARTRLDKKYLPRPEVLEKRLGKQEALRNFYGKK